MRLKIIASIGVSLSDISCVKAIVVAKNNLQQYGLKDSAAAIEAITSKAPNFPITFIDAHPRNEVTNSEDAIEQTLIRIRDEHSGIQTFVPGRMDSLTNTFGENKKVVPYSIFFQKAQALDEICKCVFFLHEGHLANMAKEYVEAVMNISEYLTAKDGEYWPILECPSCSLYSTLVYSSEGYPR